MKHKLKRFELRLRAARAWRAFWNGLGVGTFLALVLAILDATHVWHTTPVWLAVVTLGLGLVSAAIGYLRGVPAADLARSVDRRAGLEDRLSSAMGQQESAFADDVTRDAEQALGAVQPKKVYPFRFPWWRFAQVPMAFLPFALLLATANHLFLSPEARAEREELKTKVEAVQKTLDPLIKHPESLTDEQKRLARELEKLRDQLERGELNREQAQQRANKISEDAQKLERDAFQKVEKRLESAQAALDKFKKDELAGDDALDKELSSLSGKELQDKLEEIAQQHPDAKAEEEALKKEIEDLKKQLQNPDLSKQEREELAKKLEQAQKHLKSVKLSQAVQKMLEKIRNNPTFKKIQEMLSKLKQSNEQSQQNGEQELTDEQIKEMEKALDEMAKSMTDEDIQKMLDEMLQALKEGKVQLCNGACKLGLGLFGLGGGISNDSSPKQGVPLNFNKDETPGAGSTYQTAVRGERRDDIPESSPYVLQKGMAKLTGPSSVPMAKEARAAKQKAEEAISKQQVPKDQQERVRKYFESLVGTSGRK